VVIERTASDTPTPPGPKKITTRKMFAASTILALTISVPAIAVTAVMHYILETNLIITMTVGLVALFIAMGFSYKLSKKLTKYWQSTY